MEMTPNSKDLIHFQLTTPAKDNNLLQTVKDRRHFLDSQSMSPKDNQSSTNYSFGDHEKVVWLVANNREDRRRSVSRGSDTIRELIDSRRDSRRDFYKKKSFKSQTSRTRENSGMSVPTYRYNDLIKRVNSNKTTMGSYKDFDKLDTFAEDSEEHVPKKNLQSKDQKRNQGLGKIRRKFGQVPFKEVSQKIREQKDTERPPSFNKNSQHFTFLYGEPEEDDGRKKLVKVNFEYGSVEH